MMSVALCIAQEHDLRLVAVALLVCLIGSGVTAQLFGRIVATRGRSRAGWIVLCAIGTGTMVWCTHFVAMLAFHAGLPVMIDAGLTLASLSVAIVIAIPGLWLASSSLRHRTIVGGAGVGVAISAMHYTGMAAYRVDGVVEWNTGYVVSSILLSSLLSSLAFVLLRTGRLSFRITGSLVLGLAIATLHFTGMAAMKIDALTLHPAQGLSPNSVSALAMATACASMLFIGCAAISALIDGETHNEAYRHLRRMALHDGLTDLPNRVSFHEELASRIHVSSAGLKMAVINLALTRFKTVNDTHGHQAGDQLLVALAARLRAISQGHQFIARLGGDEFAALVSYGERTELDAFLARLTDLFAAPFTFERFSASVGANIGVALAPEDGQDPDTLLARADLAMYRAKSEHSILPCFYNATMDEAVRNRRELAQQLREAIAAQAFELHYQVQASATTGEISGYEVLTRWRHPARGFVPPSVFIPLAEEIGEIVPLSVWILRQACFEAALWPNKYIISVNLSALHLSDPLLVETVRQALADSKLPPERLTLELTESAIIRDRHYALRQLQAIKALGVELALDDFGVGYSSLDVLRSFAFDRIKLDASFVAEIEHDEQAIAILRAVTALGTSLHIPVLAEGIEEEAQLCIVAQEGCAAIQGYLIGRPARELVEPRAVKRIVTTAARHDIKVGLVA